MGLGGGWFGELKVNLKVKWDFSTNTSKNKTKCNTFFSCNFDVRKHQAAFHSDGNAFKDDV